MPSAPGTPSTAQPSLGAQGRLERFWEWKHGVPKCPHHTKSLPNGLAMGDRIFEKCSNLPKNHHWQVPWVQFVGDNARLHAKWPTMPWLGAPKCPFLTAESRSALLGAFLRSPRHQNPFKMSWKHKTGPFFLLPEHFCSKKSSQKCQGGK